MNELADPAVSELHAMANKRVNNVRETLEKYENWRKIINENINDHLECIRVIEELKDVEAIIQDEEAGGHGSLKDLQSEMKNEEVHIDWTRTVLLLFVYLLYLTTFVHQPHRSLQATLSEMKARVTDLQSLMTVVSTIQDAAKRVWEKMGQVKEKKAKLKYQCTCSERRGLCFFHVCFFFLALTPWYVHVLDPASYGQRRWS